MLTRLGIPGELLAELERRSEMTGEPVELVAQRLLASVLPEALAEAARDAFRHLAVAEKQSTVTVNDGSLRTRSQASGSTRLKIVAHASIAPRRPNRDARSDGQNT